MTPIDVIADAIRTADSNPSLEARAIAEVAADALTDPAVVDHAVQFVRAGRDLGTLSDTIVRSIVYDALRSVAGDA